MEFSRPALAALCRRYDVARLYLFGSALTPRFDPQRSDADVLVELLPASALVQCENLLLWDELEQLFARRVDLLTPESLRNPVLRAELTAPNSCYMTPQSQKYLHNIRLAIEAVESFVADTPAFAAYEADHKTRSAIERQLAIVGKAVNHLRRVWPEADLPNTRQMVDFRNRLIHSYDNVNNAIVHRHLPALKAEVAARLAAN